MDYLASVTGNPFIGKVYLEIYPQAFENLILTISSQMCMIVCCKLEIYMSVRADGSAEINMAMSWILASVNQFVESSH